MRITKIIKDYNEATIWLPSEAHSALDNIQSHPEVLSWRDKKHLKMFISEIEADGRPCCLTSQKQRYTLGVCHCKTIILHKDYNFTLQTTLFKTRLFRGGTRIVAVIFERAAERSPR